MFPLPGTDPSLQQLAGLVVGDDVIRVQLESIVGYGGYGVVYRALDITPSVPPALRQPFYAVKCMPMAPSTNSRRTLLQKNELAIHQEACAAGHPGIVYLHRVFVDNTARRIYVVLDYCPDGDLFTQIADNGRFLKNDALVKDAFLQILDSVEHLHANDIFHRDLKPENILCLNNCAKICIADFGLATRDRVSRELGCGSLSYMSPETLGVFKPLVNHSPALSDVWALGIILINLVCARNPWQKADPNVTEDAAFHEFVMNPDYLATILPISREINNILKRIFKLNPLDRISIPDLRIEIGKVRRFTLTDFEQQLAERALRGEKVNGVYINHPFAAMRRPPSTSSEETVVVCSTRRRQRRKPHGRKAAKRIGKLPPSIFDSDSDDRLSSDSSQDSDGPVTPEMVATHPDIADDFVDDPLDLDRPDLGSPPHHSGNSGAYAPPISSGSLLRWWRATAAPAPSDKSQGKWDNYSPAHRNGRQILANAPRNIEVNHKVPHYQTISQRERAMLNEGATTSTFLGRAIQRIKGDNISLSKNGISAPQPARQMWLY